MASSLICKCNVTITTGHHMERTVSLLQQVHLIFSIFHFVSIFLSFSLFVFNAHSLCVLCVSVYASLHQMQNTICEHHDDGKAGGVFNSYDILKACNMFAHTHKHTDTCTHSHKCASVICLMACLLFIPYGQVERIVNPRIWERYVYRRKEVAESNNNFANERMLFHGECEIHRWMCVVQLVASHTHTGSATSPALSGSPFVPYIIQNGFDERHAYIGGMFGAGTYISLCVFLFHVSTFYHCF